MGAVTLTRPEGVFTILYGLHVREQNAADIPPDTDLLVLETGIHEWLDDPEQTIKSLADHVQYKKLFSYAEAHRIPIAFVDLKYRFSDILLLLADNIFSASEWIAGYRMLSKKDDAGKKQHNLLLGAWLLLPFAANVARLTSAVTGIGLKQTAALKKLSHKLHPEAELLYLTFRNAVIAQKMAFLADCDYFTNQTVVLGAAHVGVEDMLERSSRQRMKILLSFKSLLQKLVRPSYFSSIMIIKYTGKTWNVDKVLTVPELKDVLEEEPSQRLAYV